MSKQHEDNFMYNAKDAEWFVLDIDGYDLEELNLRLKAFGCKVIFDESEDLARVEAT